MEKLAYEVAKFIEDFDLYGFRNEYDTHEDFVNEFIENINDKDYIETTIQELEEMNDYYIAEEDSERYKNGRKIIEKIKGELL